MYAPPNTAPAANAAAATPAPAARPAVPTARSTISPVHAVRRPSRSTTGPANAPAIPAPPITVQTTGASHPGPLLARTRSWPNVHTAMLARPSANAASVSRTEPGTQSRASSSPLSWSRPPAGTARATQTVTRAVSTANRPQASRHWSNRASATGPDTSTPTPVRVHHGRAVSRAPSSTHRATAAARRERPVLDPDQHPHGEHRGGGGQCDHRDPGGGDHAGQHGHPARTPPRGEDRAHPDGKAVADVAAAPDDPGQPGRQRELVGETRREQPVREPREPVAGRDERHAGQHQVRAHSAGRGRPLGDQSSSTRNSARARSLANTSSSSTGAPVGVGQRNPPVGVLVGRARLVLGAPVADRVGEGDVKQPGRASGSGSGAAPATVSSTSASGSRTPCARRLSSQALPLGLVDGQLLGVAGGSARRARRAAGRGRRRGSRGRRQVVGGDRGEAVLAPLLRRQRRPVAVEVELEPQDRGAEDPAARRR